MRPKPVEWEKSDGELHGRRAPEDNMTFQLQWDPNLGDFYTILSAIWSARPRKAMPTQFEYDLKKLIEKSQGAIDGGQSDF